MLKNNSNEFGIKVNKKLALSFFLLAIFSVLLISFASSQYTRAFPSFAQGSQFTPVSGDLQFPLFDRAMCEAGQDFLLQIDPLGCQPTVIRSDLLEDQDVAVFCPVVATQLNPLIDIQAVNNIFFTFEGPHSEGVKGIAYFPARAALGRSSFLPQGQVIQPLFNNIGYAVIILQRQPDERAIPDFFEGNLTARIRYDIQNAFGVGRATYYLPVLNDQEWEENFVRYEFWDGRGYLRANSVDLNGAGITVYSDREDYGPLKTGSKREIASVFLKKGEISREIPLPGFNFCLGTMKLKLLDIENPSTTAKLRVNEDIIEVKQGERFLENKCTVTRIDKQGVVEKVIVTCQEDQRGSTFGMSINPKVKLFFDNTEHEVRVGDRLYASNQAGKSVYLAYMGTTDNTKNENSLFVRTVSIAGDRLTLTEEELSSMACFLKKYPRGADLSSSLSETVKKGICALRLSSTINPASDFSGPINFGPQPQDSFGKQVSLNGYADAVDSDFSSISADFRDYYGKATSDYNDLRESYSNIKVEGTTTLGEKALRGQIQLAFSTNQLETTKKLCEEFKKSYPNPQPESACNDVAKISSVESSVRDVVINGRVKRISFDGINEPNFDNFGAEIEVRDSQKTRELPQKWELTKNDIIILDEQESIRLVDVSKGIEGSSSDSARIEANLRREGITTFTGTRTETLVLGVPNNLGSSRYSFTLTKVNLKQLAKVSVEPEINFAETRASFPFKIGIEKRGIQLSPEKTRERIDALNKTLEKWRSLSENLGKVVTGFKAACLGVGTTLTIKNFFTNLGGKGIARQKVMRAPGVGWFDKCTTAVSERTQINGKGPWDNVGECLLKNSDEIERSVDEYATAIDKQNEIDEALRKSIETPDGAIVPVKYIEEWKKRYMTDGNLDESIIGHFENGKTRCPNEEIDVKTVLGRINENTVFISQLRDLQLYAGLSASDIKNVQDISRSELGMRLCDIHVGSKAYAERSSFEQQMQQYVNNPQAITILDRSRIFGQVRLEDAIYTGSTAKKDISGIPKGDISGIPEGDPIQLIFFRSEKYTLHLEKADPLGTRYIIKDIYDENGKRLDKNEKIHEDIRINAQTFSSFSTEIYRNRFIDPKIRYYETAQYKGLPAIVPFDIQNGWYVGINPSLPIGGNLRASDASGLAASYSICNVGTNGKEEFNSGIADDKCRQYVRYANQPLGFYGLDENRERDLMRRADAALSEVSRRYSAGVKSVNVPGAGNIPVGEPFVGTPAIECQDFMSPTDCNLLFNVCDPVVCPSSRCNLGGTYYVQDVVASGIAGGIALCLPNFPEVKVPVCLSAIHAGVEGLVSVLDSYQQCLQASLDTGQTIGICDEIHSIYMCDFFWRQSIPLVKVATSQGIGAILGQGVRGGGEYLGVADAWQTADNSINYFTQYYAADSFKAFKARSVEDIGTELCRNFISASYPGGNLLDRLVEPDSPAQFYGRFDEIPFTTATSPPTSQYKVFYHIYAGKNLPAQYQVYLRGGGSSFYQDAFARRIVAQGFIRSGEYATETRDLTAPAGYQEMCIVVNAQEECGFKQVTTDFGINYVTESFLAQEAKRTDITSEAACVSGTTNLLPLLSPNIQGGVEEAINPAIYNRGITRVCATDNPGGGTDSFINTAKGRWQPVGYCGNPNIKCWLDTNSVRNVIKSTTIENETIGDVTQGVVEKITSQGGYLNEGQWTDLQGRINTADDVGKIQIINQAIDKVLQIPRRGLLILGRADAYRNLAIQIFGGSKPPATETTTTTPATPGIPPATPEETTSVRGCGECSRLGIQFLGCTQNSCGDISRERESRGLEGCEFIPGGFFGLAANQCVQKSSQEETTPATEIPPVETIPTQIIEVRRSYNDFSNIVRLASSQEILNPRCSLYIQEVYTASDTKIPDPLLLFAIMQQESKCDINAVSIDQSSWGLMQINTVFQREDTGERVGHCGDYGLHVDVNECRDQLLSSSILNVNVGAQVLKNGKSDTLTYRCAAFPPPNPTRTTTQKEPAVNKIYTGWETALRRYNGYNCAGYRKSDDSEIFADHKYVEEVIEIYSKLVSIASSQP